MGDFRITHSMNDQWNHNKRTFLLPQNTNAGEIPIQNHPNVLSSPFNTLKPNIVSGNVSIDQLKHRLSSSSQNISATNPFELYASVTSSNANTLSQQHASPLSQVNTSFQNNSQFPPENHSKLQGAQQHGMISRFLIPNQVPSTLPKNAENSRLPTIPYPVSSMLKANNYTLNLNQMRPPMTFPDSAPNQLSNMPPYNSHVMQAKNDNWQQYPKGPPFHIPSVTNELRNQNALRPPFIARPQMIDSISSSNNVAKNCENFSSNSAQNHLNTPTVLPSIGSNTGCQNQTVQNIPSNSFQHNTLMLAPPPMHPNINIYSHPPPLLPPVPPNSCVPPLNQQKASPSTAFISQEQRLLYEFLKKFHPIEKPPKEKKITVVEFRSAIKMSLSLMKMLSDCKDNLKKLLDCDEDQWNSQIKCILQMQNQLTEICDMIKNPSNIASIQRKLQIIKKKREAKRRQKIRILESQIKTEEDRRELNQEIDKWLENIKEKDLNLKRKLEMKKEADIILSEVRRKIHEAKRTIEKIKSLEKLRNARFTSAMQKSLFIQPEHNKRFENKVSILKETMLKQLSDYEAEEKALKVILETEQEGQLEEEALWRIKKRKAIQQKKQKHIIECLFGDTDEPCPTDPLYLFYSHHNAANSNINSLVQIRHHWDIYLAEDGEPIPQQWITPVPPSSASWEPFCNS